MSTKRTDRTVPVRILRSPSLPIRAARSLIRRASIGSYRFRYDIGAVNRPHYAYLVYHAARIAKQLGEKRVSVVEFGVAGGNGIVALEYHAENISRDFGVEIEIYGFDTAAGLPPSTDYRDLPYHWKPGFFRMDLPALRQRLKRAKLVIGDIRETIHTFVEKYDPAPIGAISYDLDFYTSTVAALTLLDAPYQYILPRIPVYFDDVVGTELEYYNDFTGVRLAIHEFNAAHQSRKLSPLYYLAVFDPATRWHHQMWSFHAFEHPLYNQFVSQPDQQRPLKPLR